MAKDCYFFTLFLKMLCKPDSKRRLAGSARQITPDNNDGNAQLRLRSQKELVMELVRNSVECGYDKVERLCRKKHR